jgi:hypothetical protein
VGGENANLHRTFWKFECLVIRRNVDGLIPSACSSRNHQERTERSGEGLPLIRVRLTHRADICWCAIDFNNKSLAGNHFRAFNNVNFSPEAYRFLDDCR